MVRMLFVFKKVRNNKEKKALRLTCMLGLICCLCTSSLSASLNAMKKIGMAEKKRNPGGAEGGGRVNVVMIFGKVAKMVMSIMTAATYADCFAYLSDSNEIAIASCIMPTMNTNAVEKVTP